MKATLEFNLPEDQEEFEIASKAMDWALMVWGIQEQIRTWNKYGEHSTPEIAGMEKILSFIGTEMEDKGLCYPE